jgi:Arc-like DNA binding domain
MARKPTDQVHLKLRFTERLRKRIEQAAAHNDRSMNEEIIRRLEQSFTGDDLVKTVKETIQASITPPSAGYTASAGYPPDPIKPEAEHLKREPDTKKARVNLKRRGVKPSGSA